MYPLYVADVGLLPVKAPGVPKSLLASISKVIYTQWTDHQMDHEFAIVCNHRCDIRSFSIKNTEKYSNFCSSQKYFKNTEKYVFGIISKRFKFKSLGSTMAYSELIFI
jgi:hypothetical protein